jgi:hypothetical protein
MQHWEAFSSTLNPWNTRAGDGLILRAAKQKRGLRGSASKP